MSEHRVSIPPEIETKVQALAEETGKPVSEWLTELAQRQVAASEKLKREKARAEADQDEGYLAALRLVEDYESRYGPIPEEDWREAEAFVASLADPAENGTHADSSHSHGMANR